MCLIIRQLPPKISEIKTIRRRRVSRLSFIFYLLFKKIFLAGKQAGPRCRLQSFNEKKFKV